MNKRRKSEIPKTNRISKYQQSPRDNDTQSIESQRAYTPKSIYGKL